MRRWKEYILAGLISCFLAVPCLSLADDEKIPEGGGGGAIALQTDGESELLQAVRAKEYEKALQIVNGQIEKNGMTTPWPIVIKPLPWNRGRLSIISIAARFTNSAKNTRWLSMTIPRLYP